MKELTYQFIFLVTLLSASCTATVQTELADPSPGYDEDRLHRIQDFQQRSVDEGTTGSNVVIVHKNGKRIYRQVINSEQEGAAPITDQSLFPIWSMTKPITIAGAMILFEEGHFLLDDPLMEYLPEMIDIRCTDEDGNIYPCKNQVTIRHIMTHRTGWSYYPGEVDGKSYLITDTVWTDLEEFSKTIAATPTLHEPGEAFTYGVNTALVGRLIEVVSKQSLYEFLKSRIFRSP